MAFTFAIWSGRAGCYRRGVVGAELPGGTQQQVSRSCGEGLDCRHGAGGGLEGGLPSSPLPAEAGAGIMDGGGAGAANSHVAPGGGQAYVRGERAERSGPASRQPPHVHAGRSKDGGGRGARWRNGGGVPGSRRPQSHFMHASRAAGVGITPDVGSVFEAELTASQVSEVVNDLRVRDALPTSLDRGRQPGSWREAARNARALLNVYMTVFRTRRAEGQAGEGSSASAGPPQATETPKEKPPADSYEVVERAPDKQLALSADMLQGLTSVQALRREHIRESPFKDLVTATHDERERRLDGEIAYLVAQYGQGATAYLMSNGMSVGKVRGYGVPTALAGVRGHLDRRAQTWVESVFGWERAADPQYIAEAQRLKFSVVVGGLARCLGRVLVAVAGVARAEDVLGEDRDFDMQSNLLKIPHTLTNAGLRSTCRHFTRRVAFALQAYRGQPGAEPPSLRAIAAEMGGPVLDKRLQDAEYARKSEEHFDRLRSGLEERVRVLEGRLTRSARQPGGGAPAPGAAAGREPQRPGGERSRWSARAVEPGRATTAPVEPEASLLASWRPRHDGDAPSGSAVPNGEKPERTSD
ncbi:MAG: hypothetical protein SGPRY_001722, partial [Prymnesium sp.]